MEDEEGNAILERNGEPKRRLLILTWSYRTLIWQYGMSALMSVVQQPNGDFVPFVQKLERSKWQDGYIAAISRIVQRNIKYHLFRCFSDFPETTYGERFINVPGPDGFTSLSASVFCWLLNIRPEYLIFHQGNICSIEPYMRSTFAHQF